MDYVTSPVQVTPGPQPAVSGSRGASPAGSGLSGFNGFLQNAAAGTAETDTVGTGVALNEESSGVRSAVAALGTGAGKGVIGSPVHDSETQDETGKLPGSLLTSSLAGNPLVLASAQPSKPLATASGIENSIVADAADLQSIVSNTQLPLTGHDGMKTGAIAGHQPPAEVTLALANGRLALTADPSTLNSPGIEDGAETVLPKLHTVIDEAGSTPAPLALNSAVPAGADMLPPQAALSTTNAKPTTLTTSEGPIGTTLPAVALSANDSLIKADRSLSQPFQQGGNAGQGIPENLTLLPPRGPVPALAANPASDPRLQQIPTGVTTALPQDNGIAVSASIASTGVAQGLVSRQRTGAANDDSVSQIARGGNEARMLELNGARTGNAVAQGNTVVTAAVDTSTESDVKHTNAIALAATRDEKSLRAAMPVVNQQQMAARIGGVDVTQIGAVDFAATQVDATSASPTGARIAILEPGWTSQLGTDLRALVARGPSTTQVQITPAELGPLDIEVSVNRQEVSVRILAMHGQTREMLEAALPRLREVLGQTYSGVDVSVGSGSGNSSSHGQSQHNGGQAGTMAMMSDAEQGLRDSASTRDTALADGGEDGDETNKLATDDPQLQADGSPAPNNPRPVRGLVDAYA